MIKMMNGLLGDFVVAAHKVQGLHWYVKGPDFFMAHAKLEEIYDELQLMVDETAEVMLMCEMKPVATMGEFASHAQLEEAKLDFTTSKDAFAIVAKDYAALIENVGDVKAKAESEHLDLIALKCDTFHETLAKTHWMLTQR
ncbi:MAG: DNA starvation/stationary phase protection protein [Eggerthellaceae bacterium]|nr:DNA starvation/stationary phase protection protein [Eggerthellaceae bacterium]